MTPWRISHLMESVLAPWFVITVSSQIPHQDHLAGLVLRRGGVQYEVTIRQLP